MKRIRDGPGKRKVAIGAAFFVGKKTSVQAKKQRMEIVSGKKDRLQEIRNILCQMTMGSETEVSQDAMTVLYAQIDEMLHAPLLIWKNGVCYNSWANCLSNKSNSDDSRGDTKVSLF